MLGRRREAFVEFTDEFKHAVYVKQQFVRIAIRQRINGQRYIETSILTGKAAMVRLMLQIEFQTLDEFRFFLSAAGREALQRQGSHGQHVALKLRREAQFFRSVLENEGVHAGFTKV